MSRNSRERMRRRRSGTKDKAPALTPVSKAPAESAVKESAWEFQIDDQNGVDSTLWVRWCLKPAGSAYFQAIGLNPLVLIIVSYPGHPDLEQRFLPKVELCMYRIWLRRPGKVKIHAMLLWENKDSITKRFEDDHDAIEKRALRRSDDLYSTSAVFYRTGDLIDQDVFCEMRIIYDYGRQALGNTEFNHYSFNVHVDAEVFAPEPPAWERNYLNRYGWFKKAEDQCRYRQMRLIGWPLVSLIIPFEVIIKWLVSFVTIVFGLSWGMTRQSYKPLLQPWKYPFGAVWHPYTGKEGSELSFWLQNPVIAMTSPFMLLCYTALCWFVFDIRDPLRLMIAVVLITAGMMAMTGLVYYLSNVYIEIRTSLKKTETLSTTIERPQPKFLTVPSAVCVGGLKAEPMVPAVLDPKAARNRTLRYLDLKGKVCKPYPM